MCEVQKMCFGKKDSFSLEITCNSESYFCYNVYFYISGVNILEYTYQGTSVKTFTWHTLSYLIDWLKENLQYIMDESDTCVHLPPSRPALQTMWEINRTLPFDELEKVWEEIQQWYFKHSWLDSRDGAYLADVCFRMVRKKIEISWDNCDLYPSEEVRFSHPSGFTFVEPEIFLQVMTDFISYWEDEGKFFLPQL